MNIVKKYTETSLILRILIGMAIGIVLALICPKAAAIGILGDLFVGALKAIAPILVLVLIMSSLANAKEGHDSNMKIIIILYLASTLLGALVAVVGSFLFPVKMSVAGVDSATNTAPEGIGQVLHNLLMNVIDNPVHALANANYLGILAWACVLGIALRKPAQRQSSFCRIWPTAYRRPSAGSSTSRRSVSSVSYLQRSQLPASKSSRPTASLYCCSSAACCSRNS